MCALLTSSAISGPTSPRSLAAARTTDRPVPGACGRGGGADRPADLCDRDDGPSGHRDDHPFDRLAGPDVVRSDRLAGPLGSRPDLRHPEPAHCWRSRLKVCSSIRPCISWHVSLTMSIATVICNNDRTPRQLTGDANSSAYVQWTGRRWRPRAAHLNFSQAGRSWALQPFDSGPHCGKFITME